MKLLNKNKIKNKFRKEKCECCCARRFQSQEMKVTSILLESNFMSLAF